MNRWLRLTCTISACFTLLSSGVYANEQKPTREQVLDKRMAYYMNYSSDVLPWYYLAAIDQYERNIQEVRNDLQKRDGVVAMQFSDDYWVGPLNPQRDDTYSLSIAFFNGHGADGNGDGVSDRKNDDDVLWTLVELLNAHGQSEKDYKAAIKEYYQNDLAVNQIMTTAKIYQHFETINLDQHAFPLPLRQDYSYRNTWGDRRGWGGRRIHEGTDLFASFGMPVKSTSYGMIEVMGWNEYGGWRVGIRDVNNTYHYYAHLSSFNKKLKQGDFIEPGAIIGYVGSSGYGKKWTSGRFPPHLHYGMYKFNGRTEWAYDPYPSLRRWEQEERKRGN